MSGCVCNQARYKKESFYLNDVLTKLGNYLAHAAATAGPRGGDAGGGRFATKRAPQSLQSVPRSQIENSAPGPPSSQLPSLE